MNQIHSQLATVYSQLLTKLNAIEALLVKIEINTRPAPKTTTTTK